MSETEALVPRDVEGLLRLEERGERPKYLYFWGHQPPRGGGIGAGCLSQWWECAFTVEGVAYRSAEQFMMAEKARLFGDERTVARILASRHPGETKTLGRQVAAFDQETWEAHRYGIVVRASIAKFGQDPGLREYLRSTRRRVLVEASPLDRIWGIGLAADDARAAHPAQWQGLNLLGFALMEARTALAA